MVLGRRELGTHKEGTTHVTEAEPGASSLGSNKGDIDAGVGVSRVVIGEFQHNGEVVLGRGGGDAANVEGEECFDRVAVGVGGDAVEVAEASVRGGHKPVRARGEAKGG
jgi:hypothetical protein